MDQNREEKSAPAWNPGTWEAEDEELTYPGGQPKQYIKPLSQMTKQQSYTQRMTLRLRCIREYEQNTVYKILNELIKYYDYF